MASDVPGSLVRVRSANGGQRGTTTLPAPVPSLAALVASLERRAADADRIHATAEVAVVLRDVVAEITALDGRAVLAEQSVAAADHLLTAPEVAARLGCSAKLVYRSAGRWPFTRRVGPKTLRFSASGLARWLERRR